MWRACLLLVVLLGCPKRDVDRTDPVPGLLQEADVLWEDRGEVGLSAVEQGLLAAWGSDSSNPEVLWRLVRLKVAQGLSADDPGQARYAYAEGRSLGVQCLDGAPAFRQQRREVSWQGAVERIPLEREACAAWTALAWARWLETHGGEAGALDLDSLDALIAGLDGDGPDAVTAWAEGLVAAVRPTWSGRDLERADQRLRRAVAASPRDLVRRVDLFLLVQWHTLGDERDQARQQLISKAASTPEDQRARRRLEEAAPARVAPPSPPQ